MAHSFTDLLKDGQNYMVTWPVRKELYGYFPEARVISATRFSLKVMPPMAVLVTGVMVNTLGWEYLPQALAIGAFFLSLPLQGLLWLGHRSNQLLPPSIRHWYLDIHRKMITQGCQLQAAKSRPRYIELARLLKTAFDDLDKVFTGQWF